MKVKQCTLVQGGRVTTGWLPEIFKGVTLKAGTLVTLKDFDDGWWTIQSISDAAIEQKDINQAWNVGGVRTKR